MSDAIVLRALQLREHRVLELEDENRRLKAALYEADRESTQRIGEEVARANAAEAKVARVEELRQMYKRDDEESLNTFGQHHPVAGIAYDHLTAALADEETT